MKSPRIILIALLLAQVAEPHLNGAQTSDFDQKAATLFSRKYSFHAWNETDHTVDGEDWSLPLWVTNKGTNSLGLLKVSRRQFAFDTTLEPEVLQGASTRGRGLEAPPKVQEQSRAARSSAS